MGHDPAATEAVEHTLLVADYSSLEIGIQGDLCLRLFGDDQIAEMYADQAPPKKLDMHSGNAREVFGKWLGWTVPERVMVDGRWVGCPFAGQRVDAIPVQTFKQDPYGDIVRYLIKAVWYGLAYGKFNFDTLVGPDGKMIGKQVSTQMREALLDAKPGMRHWFKWVEKYIDRHRGIYSLGGRWCDLTAEFAAAAAEGSDWQIKRAYRRGYNFPMQATGAEIIGDAMARVMRDPEFRALGFYVILQVHDELVARGPLKNVERATEILVRHMTEATANGTRLRVDLQVSAGHGPNYYEAK